MIQYCYLLDGLTGETLRGVADKGGFEGLRTHLRGLGIDAYRTKVAEVEGVSDGMMPEAQKFFLLTQTDLLWKEHLQAIKFLQQAVGLRGYAAKDPLTGKSLWARFTVGLHEALFVPLEHQ
jgi:preprotein translocase subunit SecA